MNAWILGSGTMGLDIAQVFAAAGHPVTVRDLSEPLVAKAQARVTNGLEKRVERGKLTVEAKDALLANLTFTTDIANVCDADIVIEAIVENLEIKQTVFRELDSLTKPECVLATNTSSLSVTAIAAACNHPERVLGLHFFNPATVMKLVEVIRAEQTCDAAFEAAVALMQGLGKEPVIVKESPGFVVNRLLVPMINEAILLLEMGVADAQGIDSAMKLGAGHPMGPLALADLIGLDVCLFIMDSLFEETKDPKFRAATLLKKMVRAGKLGKKTKAGFYSYAL